MWWLDNHIVARHALQELSLLRRLHRAVPAAQYYEDYNPRTIVDVALSRDEGRLVELLQSDVLWYCGQCGSCKTKCPREEQHHGVDLLAAVSQSAQGLPPGQRTGPAAVRRPAPVGHNFWNRAFSLYFRNATAAAHPDFGPRYAQYWSEVEPQMRRLGATPDARGDFGGKKVNPETLAELRRCVQWGGTLVLWQELEKARDGAMRPARA